jgi:DNA-directed RNA polymerase
LDNWNNLSVNNQHKRANLQIALEEDLQEYSLNKYWQSLDHNIIEGNPEQNLVKQYIAQATSVYAGIQEEIVKDMRGHIADLVKLPPDVLAGIVITQIVEDLVDSRDMRKRFHSNGVENAYSVAYRIGKEVKMCIGFRQARDTDAGKEQLKYLNRYIKNWDSRKRDRFAKRWDSVPQWTKRQTLMVGTTLLHVAAEQELVTIERKNRIEGGKTRQFNQVTMNPDIMLELIRQHEHYQFLKLVYRPMLVPPVPHTLDQAGGCLTMDRRKPTVGGISKASQAHLDAVNIMQTTEWKINERVLEVMQTLYAQNEGLCNMPAYDFEEFTFSLPYPEEGTQEEKRSWKVEKEAKYSKWYKEVQKRAQMEIRLTLAQKMAKTEFFYHSYTCDFRGRAYTITEMLSPQSGDFDRGLLQFATPCKVTNEGLYWLMVHTANCFDGVDFGNGEASDKDTFDDRVRWVKANIKDLRKISEDPYANNTWMDNKTTKKNPSFQRLAAAVDLVHALDTGYSSLPVQLDGSCNGSQHWSAIMRDPKIGELVNVSPTDKPGDLYQHVADIGTAICAAGGSEWKEIFYEHWDHRIPRKVFKRSTMCDAYGITDHGIRRYSRDEGHLEWVEDDPVKKVQAVNELALVIRHALDGAMESSNAGKIFLQEIVEICAGLERHARWYTPTGFEVTNRYTKAESKIAKSTFYRNRNGVRLNISTVEDTDEVNKDFAIQAIPPNFIHSIDAAHMMLVILDMASNGVSKFSMIHDSFGCPCNDVPIMREAINRKFYEIHKENLLESFKKDIEDAVIKQPIARELPQRGELDIRGALKSDYLFG